jgi:hypothetical protein
MSSHTLEPVMGGVWPIPEVSSIDLFYCPKAKWLVSFLNGTNLFRNHDFFSPSFSWAFLSKLKDFQIFLLCFLIPLITANLTKSSQQ